MKKYLIKGALALFAGAFLFSCAEKESEYIPLAQRKSKAFDDVFKEIYGDVDPYQDWGFSSGKVEIDPNDSTQVVEVVDLDNSVAVTRTVAFSRSGAMTRGVIKESHELPAGLTMPTLKEGEADYVMEWFQENDGENSEGLDITKFFIVYVGGNNSVKIYSSWDESVNNGNVTLDYLEIDGEHINDWNANNGPTVYVYDTNANNFTSHNSYCNLTTDKWKLAQITYQGEEGYYVGLSAYGRKNETTEKYQLTDYDRENYYDDWVFKIVPADAEPEPEPEPEPVITYKYPVYEDVEWRQVERGRVFCEDLGIATREDLDYNDVVFDAIIFKKVSTKRMWEVKFVDGVKTDSTECHSEPGKTETYPQVSTNYYANVEILAAGGTIPVTIQGNRKDSKAYQVHNQFKPTADIATMVNTRDNNSTAYGSFEERNPVQLGEIEKNFQAILPNGKTEDYNVKLFEIDYPADAQTVQAIKDIKIVSNFGEAQQVEELKSERGENPRKFMAPYGTLWTSERKNISLAYPLFGKWVKNKVTRDECFSSDNTNTNYLYSGAYQSNGLKLPLVMKARRSYALGTENEIWSGANEFGSTWNLKKVKTNHPLSSSKGDIKFYPGDRLRFYGTQIKDDAWITVLIGDISPYFIDSEFPNYILDSKGKKQKLALTDTACIEVLLDEWSAGILNEQIKNNDGILQFQVQGRNFTLTRICRVLFE